MKRPATSFTAPDLAALADGLDCRLDFDDMESPEQEKAGKIHLPRKLVHRRRPAARRAFDFSAVQNAVARLNGLPANGETWHLIQDPSFNGFDLIAAVIRLARQPCRSLTVATLGTNARAIAGFKAMMDAGTLGKLTVLLSVYFRDADRDACNGIMDRLREIGADVHCLRIHAKLSLFDFGSRHIVAEGSGNVRSCRCVEQVTLTDDRSLFDFYSNALDSLTRS